MKLSIIIPTYKKPKSIIRCLESANKYCKNAEIIVIIDDESVLAEARKISNKYKFFLLGDGTGVAMAVWKGVLVASGDIIAGFGDDVEFIQEGFDDEMARAIEGSAPDTIVGVNDGIGNGRSHSCMRKEFWLSGGGFPPCYRHYYGDTEIQKTALQHNRWLFLKDVKIIHHHPYHVKQGFKNINVIEDPTKANQLKSKGDGEIYKKRIKWWEENNKPRTIPWDIY